MNDSKLTCMCCNKCNIIKPIEDFPYRDKKKSDKRRKPCRACAMIATMNSSGKNIEKRRAYVRKWLKNNPEKRKEYAKRDRNRPCGGSGKKWRRKHPEKTRQYARNYRDKYPMTIQARMRVLLGNRLRKKIQKGDKKHSIINLIGCSLEELKIYIQSLWLEGMSWENWGTYRVEKTMTWHIDHIIPCASFDLSKEEEQRKCFHYSNLQPLWAIDNIRKSNKI